MKEMRIRAPVPDSRTRPRLRHRIGTDRTRGSKDGRQDPLLQTDEVVPEGPQRRWSALRGPTSAPRLLRESTRWRREPVPPGRRHRSPGHCLLRGPALVTFSGVWPDKAAGRVIRVLYGTLHEYLRRIVPIRTIPPDRPPVSLSKRWIPLDPPEC
jgi:hypothetical protein